MTFRISSDLVLTSWVIPSQVVRLSSGVIAHKCIMRSDRSNLIQRCSGMWWPHSFHCVNANPSWAKYEGRANQLISLTCNSFIINQTYIYTAQWPYFDLFVVTISTLTTAKLFVFLQTCKIFFRNKVRRSGQQRTSVIGFTSLSRSHCCCLATDLQLDTTRKC